jgi:phasin family protein
MAQPIPAQWFSMESNGFDRLFGITNRCCDVFERLTALNLKAIQVGLAETQEVLAQTDVASNLPEMLCLPTLLAPVRLAQALSYSRQFFEIVSDLQGDLSSQQMAGRAQQRALGDRLFDSVSSRSLVPGDAPVERAMSSTSTARASEKPSIATTAMTARHKKKLVDKTAPQPTHVE